MSSNSERWRKRIELGFKTALAGLCPEGGIAYILSRYHGSDIFFPIICAPLDFDDTDRHYYFFPFAFTRLGCFTIELRSDYAAVSALDKQCRLELAFSGFNDCVYQRVDALLYETIDGKTIPELLLVRSSPTAEPPALTDAPHTEAWLHETARTLHEVWEDLHCQNSQCKDGGIEDIVEDIWTQLADTLPSPPYYPVLRFQISLEEAAQEVTQRQRSGHNFLAFNCHLRSFDPSIAAPWVFDAIKRFSSAETQWIEDCIEFLDKNPDKKESLPPEVTHYIQQTKDLVRIVAVCEMNGTKDIFLVRHNKLRNRAFYPDGTLINQTNAPGVITVDGGAQGLRVLLQVNPHDDDVLLTFWVINCSNKPFATHLGAKRGKHAFHLTMESLPEGAKELREHPFLVRWLLLPGDHAAAAEADIKRLLASRSALLTGLESKTMLTPNSAQLKIIKLVETVNTAVFHTGRVGLFPQEESTTDPYHEPGRWPVDRYNNVAPIASETVRSFLQGVTARYFAPHTSFNPDLDWEITALNKIRYSWVTLSLFSRIADPTQSLDPIEQDREFRKRAFDWSDSEVSLQKAALLILALRNLNQSNAGFEYGGMQIERDQQTQNECVLVKLLGKDNGKNEKGGLPAILKAAYIDVFAPEAVEVQESKAKLTEQGQTTTWFTWLKYCGAKLSLSYLADSEQWLFEARFPLMPVIDCCFLPPNKGSL